MEIQTPLTHHYEFISVENITMLSVSSDDYLHASFKVAEQQMWNYSSYSEDKKKDKKQKVKNKKWKIKIRLKMEIKLQIIPFTGMGSKYFF